MQHNPRQSEKIQGKGLESLAEDATSNNLGDVLNPEELQKEIEESELAIQ